MVDPQQACNFDGYKPAVDIVYIHFMGVFDKAPQDNLVYKLAMQDQDDATVG